jgi:hypothetical protein
MTQEITSAGEARGKRGRLRLAGHIVALGVCLSISCCAAAGVLLLDQPLPWPRKLYNAFAPSELAQFQQRLDLAQSSGADWANDPQVIGLWVAGYPNSDGTTPDRVYTFTSADRATIVVSTLGCMDNSIRDKEARVDLVQVGTAWQIEWAGSRWRCTPGRGHRWWSPARCS